MEMMILPFVCLGIGIFLGVFVKWNKFAKLSDRVATVALIFMMLTIGIQIGIDKSIIDGFLTIGLNCLVIVTFAMFFSVLLTIICEKTFLPLQKLDLELQQKHISVESVNNEHSQDSDASLEEENSSGSKLVWLMPSSIILGLLLGIFLRGIINPVYIEHTFTLSLILLYISVGISQGANKEVFKFIKLLGVKVIWISVAVLLGSLIGGLMAGLLLDVPMKVSVISASGMSFYSYTGAFMTDSYGLEAGTYGFIVNILREFLTVLLLPLLIKITPGSPIASGGAGDMDTLLAPITKFVGIRLGIVALVTGTILTSVVILILPLISIIF